TEFLKRLEVAYSLTDALASCHATTFRDEIGIQVSGVYHGDIKPANILIDTKNTPFLIDFLQIDVQRLIDLELSTAGLARLHQHTMFFGTLGFMDEQQERYGVITTETDTYSLGVTFTHLFRSLDIRDDDNHRNRIFDFFSDEAIPESLRELTRGMVGIDVK